MTKQAKGYPCKSHKPQEPRLRVLAEAARRNYYKHWLIKNLMSHSKPPPHRFMSKRRLTFLYLWVEAEITFNSKKHSFMITVLLMTRTFQNKISFIHYTMTHLKIPINTQTCPNLIAITKTTRNKIVNTNSLFLKKKREKNSEILTFGDLPFLKINGINHLIDSNFLRLTDETETKSQNL